MTLRAWHRAPEIGTHRVRILAILLASLLVAASGLDASAQRVATAARPAGPPAIKAAHAILMDAQSGATIFQQNADQATAPYGLSKLMALAVVFRELKAGKIKLTDDVKMSVNAWKSGGAPSPWTPMFVKVNTTEPLETLLQGMIVQSANDAAIAIAEAIAGNEAEFARMMTAEARRIGLTKATFSNATGMPTGPEQAISAYELAVLARYLMRTYPEHYARFSQKLLVYGKYRFVNDNPLLGNLGVDGLKTGFVKKNSFGLVASANKDGRRLILVLQGLEKPADVKADGEKLLEWGFDALHDVKLFEADEVVASARVWGGDRMWVPLKGAGAVTIVLPRYPPNQKLKAEVIYERPLKLPITKGDKVAVLRVTTSSNSVSEVPLYAAESVKPGGIVRRGLDTIVHHTLGWFL